MPNVQLPICLGTQLTQHHQVNTYLSIPQEHKLITGGIHGDIIIWNVHHTSDVQSNNQQTLLSPIRYLTPSLSLTVGPVVLLQAIHNPITSELECSGTGLLSIHEDRRVRVWDLQDGRCLNISTHSPFQISTITCCQPLTQTSNRFFAVAGVGKAVEIFDVWKLETIFSFPLDKGSLEVKDIAVVIDKQELLIVDDKNLLYRLDISEYCNEELSIYSRYCKKQKECNKLLKNAKCTLLSKFRITTSKKRSLKSILVDSSLPFVLFIYPTSIIFVEKAEIFSNVSNAKDKQKIIGGNPINDGQSQESIRSSSSNNNSSRLLPGQNPGNNTNSNIFQNNNTQSVFSSDPSITPVDQLPRYSLQQQQQKAFSTPSGFASNQQQLRLMIQRSDDLLNANSSTFSAAAGGATQGNSVKATPIPKLNLKVKLQLHEEFTEEVTNHLFDSVKVVSIEEVDQQLLQSTIIVFFADATIQLLAVSDILKLSEFAKNNIHRDFTFDFASFAFSKRENQTKSKLSMKLLEIMTQPSIQGSKQPNNTSISGISDGNSNNIILGYDSANKYILHYNVGSQILSAIPIEQHFKKILGAVAQIKNLSIHQSAESIAEENTINYMDIFIQFMPNSIQDNLYKKIDLSAWQLPRPEMFMSHYLGWNQNSSFFCQDNQLFNAAFFLKYGTALQERFKDEIITVSCIDFIKENTNNNNIINNNNNNQMNQNSSSNSLNSNNNNGSLNYNSTSNAVTSLGDQMYYFFGTKQGKVIGIPVLYSEDREQCDILQCNLGTSVGGICLLEIKCNNLIVSSESGLTLVIALQDVLVSNPNDRKSIRDRLKVIDLNNHIKFKQQFASPLKHLMALNIPHGVIADQSNNYSDILNDTRQQLSTTIGMITTTNSVILYNFASQSVQCECNSNKTSICGLYIHPITDYLLILLSDDSINIWSLGSKRFEKSTSLAQFSSVFDLEGVVTEKYGEIEKSKNSYAVFKQIYGLTISKAHSLLEYNMRLYDDAINYGDSSSGASSRILLYEQLGELKENISSAKPTANLLWMLEYLEEMVYQSKSEEIGISVLKMKLNRIKQQSFTNQQFLIMVDPKRYNSTLLSMLESAAAQNQPEKDVFSYVSFAYPWGDQVKKADLSISNIIGHKKPVFKYVIGVAGMGTSFAFSLEKSTQYATSSFLSSLQALSILLHLMSLGVLKDTALTYNVMLEVANLFTKNKRRVSPHFKNLSLSVLARFCIDDSNEVMSSASNLIINSLVYKDDDILRVTKMASELFSVHIQREKDQEVKFSTTEITWLMMITYSNIFAPPPTPTDMSPYIRRIVSGVELRNCLGSPELVAPCMKILTEGIALWKDMIQNYKELLANLVIIYFHYNTQNEQLEAIKDIPKPQSKKSLYLDLFLRQPPQVRKRMKLMTIKTIISLVNVSQNEFLALANKEIANTDRHPLYPCSIIDIIRNYIKVQSVNAQTRLPFFIEIILKSLDPNIPQIRKICHGPASKALLTIFQQFPTISYNQSSQKYAVGTNSKQIFIYDLRTAVKWRILGGQGGTVTSLCFDSAGKQIASFSSEDYQLRVWKIGSNGFFSSILNINGTPAKTISVPRSDFEEQVKAGCKIIIVWDDNDKKILIKFGHEIFRTLVD